MSMLLSGGLFNVIPDSVVDSFEDESLSEYDSATQFGTTTNRAFDGNVSVQQSTGSNAHVNMRWGEQTIESGETATSSVWLWLGGVNRAGPTLVDSNGDGYLAYVDNNEPELSVFNVADDSIGTKLDNVSLTYPTSEWVKADLSFDGVDTYTATVYDNTETKINSVSGTDTTHTPDRHGFHQYDAGIEADLLEKSL